MARLALDHITICCRDLDRSRRFYADILGLENGYRPPFHGPPGVWLYHRGRPVVHLYAAPPQDEADPQDEAAGPARAMALDHIAFAVDDPAAVEAIRRRLLRRGQSYETATVPRSGAGQIFFADPDGVKIEVTAPAAGPDERDEPRPPAPPGGHEP